MPDLKIEIGSPLRADLKVGEGSADKLVDALVDTFSPATETLGLFGDVVRLARVEVAAHPRFGLRLDVPNGRRGIARRAPSFDA